MNAPRIDLPRLTGTIVDVRQRRWAGVPRIIVTVQADTLWRRGLPEPAAEVDAIALRFPIEREDEFRIGERIEIELAGLAPGTESER